MSLSETIEAQVKALYNSMRTQQAVANELCVSQQFIQQLLSGKVKFDNVKVSVVDKMFPNAIYNLAGTVNINKNHNSQIINGSAVGLALHSPFSKSEFLRTLSKKIMASEELTAEQKVKFYNFLNNET